MIKKLFKSNKWQYVSARLAFYCSIGFITVGALTVQDEWTRTVDTVAQLVARGGVSGQNKVVHVLGYHAPGDGGGGLFMLTNTATATNLGTRIYSGVAGKSWERVRPRGVLIPEWFGVVMSDGVDDQARFQATLNQSGLDGGGYVFTSPGMVDIQSDLVVSNKTTVKGSGIAATDFNMTTGTFTVAGIRAEGSLTVLPALGANITKGDKIITFATPHSLLTNQVFRVRNRNDYSYSSARAYYQAGEAFKVTAVLSTTQVEVETSAFDSYATADTDCWKVNGVVAGLKDLGIRFKQGVTLPAVKIVLGTHLSLSDLDISGSRYAQIFLDRCYEVTAHRLYLFDEQASVGLNYGIIVGSSQRVNINDSYCATSRHGLATGGADNDGEIVSREVTYKGGTISSSLGIAVGLDFHGNTEHCTVENVFLPNGAGLGGDFITYRGCTIWNDNDNAYCIGEGEQVGMSFTLEGNKFFARRNFSSLVNALRRPTTTRKGALRIIGNEFHVGTFASPTYPSANTYSILTGVGNTATAGLTDFSIEVSGNHFYSEQTVTGPFYHIFYAALAAAGQREAIIKNNVLYKGAIRTHRNIGTTIIEDNVVTGSPTYGIIHENVSSASEPSAVIHVKRNTITGSHWTGLMMTLDTASTAHVRGNTATDNAAVPVGSSVDSNIRIIGTTSNAGKVSLFDNTVGDYDASPTALYTYYINSVDTLKYGGNENVGAGVNTISYAHISIGNITEDAYGSFNVKMRGARGDGTTDDSAAIQATVNAALAASYDETVFFPPGIFVHNTPITDTSDGSSVRWRGAGIHQTYLKAGAAMTHQVKFGLSGNVFDGRKTVEGISFDGNSLATYNVDAQELSYSTFKRNEFIKPASGGFNLRIGKWGNLIENNIFNGNTVANGIELIGTPFNGVKIKNQNTFTDHLVAIKAANGVNEVEIQGNTFDRATQAAVWFRGGSGSLSIKNNYFELSGTTGVSVEEAAASFVTQNGAIVLNGLYNALSSTLHENVIIEENEFANCDTDGVIALANITGVKVRNNHLTTGYSYSKYIVLFWNGSPYTAAKANELEYTASGATVTTPVALDGDDASQSHSGLRITINGKVTAIRFADSKDTLGNPMQWSQTGSTGTLTVERDGLYEGTAKVWKLTRTSGSDKALSKTITIDSTTSSSFAGPRYLRVQWAAKGDTGNANNLTLYWYVNGSLVSTIAPTTATTWAGSGRNVTLAIPSTATSVQIAFQPQVSTIPVWVTKLSISEASVALGEETSLSDYGLPLITRGDILKRGATEDERLAIGSRWQVLGTDGTDPMWGDDGKFGLMFRKKVTRLFFNSTTLVGDGTAPASTGTASLIAPTSTTPMMVNYVTAAATTGTDLGVQENGAYHYFGRAIRMHAWLKLEETTAVRYWVGFSGGAGSSMAGAEDATTDIAAFRYSTVAGDANWKCVTNDGGSPSTITDSGVAASTSFTVFTIEHTPGVNVKFYINGTLVQTHTTDLPRSTGAGRMMAFGETTENVVKNLRVFTLYSEEAKP